MSDTHVVRPSDHGGGLGRWLALLGVAVAIGVIISLATSWPDHGARTLSLSRPAPAAHVAPAPRRSPGPASRAKVNRD